MHSEDLSRQCSDRQQLERDLDEASRRLAMAHLDIRRLTDELDAARKNHGMSGTIHGTGVTLHMNYQHQTTCVLAVVALVSVSTDV